MQSSRAIAIFFGIWAATWGCSSDPSGSEANSVATGGALGTGGTEGGSGGNDAPDAQGGPNTGGSGGSAGTDAGSGAGGTSASGGSDASAPDAKTDVYVVPGDAGPLPADADVLSVLKKVADWQLKSLGTTTPNGWIHGAMWTGILALYDSSKDQKYRDAATRWADANSWQLTGAPTTNADNQCAAQDYFELYLMNPTPANKTLMVDKAKVSFDTMIASGSAGWTWVDALFMSPPGVARLYTITQDANYLTFLHAQWQKTSTTFFSTKDGLWWRDPPPSIASGKPRDIFWSRGNGWVMAASARVYDHLPTTDTNRAIYAQNIKTMAAALFPLQQSDGMWRSDLLHPDAYPNPESSGSAFFTYAIAWGIKNGILDRAVYEPVVIRAWKGLVTCVAQDGLFGYVQPPNWAPGPATATNTSPYGVGAFLLAGTAIMGLN